MKKLKLFTLAIGLIAGVSIVAKASRTDIFAYSGDGILHAVELLRLTANGWLYLGSPASANIPTTSYYPHVSVPLKNNTSSAWALGDLIVVDPSCVGCGKTGGATNNLTTWVGIAEGATPAGSVGMVVTEGYAIAKTTSTVNRGDALVSTASAAGYLTGAAAPTTGADVAVAIASGTAAGGTTLVLVR